MRHRSKKKQQAVTAERFVREEVFRRDRECLLSVLGDCWGDLTYHHRRKASSGGAYIPANGACLCARHNTLVEDSPEYFHGDGRFAHLELVVREGDDEWESLGRRANR